MTKGLDKWGLLYTLLVFGSVGLLIGGAIGYYYIPNLIKYEREECFKTLDKCNSYYIELQYNCNGKFLLFQDRNYTFNLTDYKMIYK